AGNRQDVADAPFDDLELNRPKPRAVEIFAGVPKPSLCMQEDDGVARSGFSIPPGQSSPAELHDQPVVAVSILGKKPAPYLSADPNRRSAVNLVDHREDPLGVARVVIDQPGLEVRERLAVKQIGDGGRLDCHRYLGSSGSKTEGCDQRDGSEGFEIGHHDALVVPNFAGSTGALVY